MLFWDQENQTTWLVEGGGHSIVHVSPQGGGGGSRTLSTWTKFCLFIEVVAPSALSTHPVLSSQWWLQSPKRCPRGNPRDTLPKHIYGKLYLKFWGNLNNYLNSDAGISIVHKYAMSKIKAFFIKKGEKLLGTCSGKFSKPSDSI